MLDLMYEHEGVGLAANQVDLPIRMFVVNASGARGDGEEMVLINPELQLPKGSDSMSEGCLSLPGIRGEVRRPKSIRLSAYDLAGNAIERNIDDFLARILLHENDHLDGVMFFDRMSDDDRAEIEDQIDELVREFRAKQASGTIEPDEQLIANLSQWTEKYA
jgi:peptide deformylase